MVQNAPTTIQHLALPILRPLTQPWDSEALRKLLGYYLLLLLHSTKFWPRIFRAARTQHNVEDGLATFRLSNGSGRSCDGGHIGAGDSRFLTMLSRCKEIGKTIDVPWHCFWSLLRGHFPLNHQWQPNSCTPGNPVSAVQGLWMFNQVMIQRVCGLWMFVGNRGNPSFERACLFRKQSNAVVGRKDTVLKFWPASQISMGVTLVACDLHRNYTSVRKVQNMIVVCTHVAALLDRPHQQIV